MPSFRRFGLLGFLALVLSAPAHAAPPVIGLFTDYGWDDPSVAQVKGSILTIDSSARILDLTHSVTSFNIAEGAYLLDECADEFPGGTIFVAVVDSPAGTDRPPVLLQTAKGKFFIGPDNGLLSHVIAHEGFGRAWILDRPEFFRAGDTSHAFRGRDIFGPVAAHLAAGTDPDRFGTPVKTLMVLPEKIPTFAGGIISTQVIHIDHSGNVILNLDSANENAAKLHFGNLVRISIGKETNSAPLVKTYGDGEKGRLLLLYGSNGLLEISMNQGSAARQLKVEPGASVFLKP